MTSYQKILDRALQDPAFVVSCVDGVPALTVARWGSEQAASDNPTLEATLDLQRTTK